MDKRSCFCYEPPQFVAFVAAGALVVPFIVETHINPKTGTHVQVLVRDNNVDQALRALKKKMQREGLVAGGRVAPAAAR